MYYLRAFIKFFNLFSTKGHFGCISHLKFLTWEFHNDKFVLVYLVLALTFQLLTRMKPKT